MHAYEVGKLYHPDRRRWPEGADYNWRSGEHELRLFYRAPTMQETAEIRGGALDLALLVRGDLLVLLWRFGGGHWSDQPYSYHLVPRVVTLSPEFTVALHDAIRAQAARPWPGDQEYARQIEALYAEYPTSSAMVRDAAACCRGGS